MIQTCAAAPHDRFDLVDLRDFLEVNLTRLAPKRRAVIALWSKGKTPKEIAAERGVTEEAVYDAIARGVRDLREFAQAYLSK